jgi:hypothetical protein
VIFCQITILRPQNGEVFKTGGVQKGAGPSRPTPRRQTMDVSGRA